MRVPHLSRRPALAGLLGFLGLGVVVGGGYEVFRLSRPRFPPSPFDDVLGQLADRDSAARLGRAVLAQPGGFDAARAAASLRQRDRVLTRSLRQDLAQGRLADVQGWLLPQTMVNAAGLAAQVAAPQGAHQGSPLGSR